MKYIDLISFLGVEISTPKRVVPTPGYRGLEFASKLFSQGVELSPLPFGLILEGGIQSLFSFWNELEIIKSNLMAGSVCETLDDICPVRNEHAPDLGPVFPIRGSQELKAV
jgi:hypothetical protein